MRELQRVEGRITIPDQKERMLIQPEGRTWRYFHEVILRWFGAIIILMPVVTLGIAYLILGHIYIGTIGMEGAFEAMWTGEVDLNWAKEHHRLWLESKAAERGDAPEAASLSAKPTR